MKKQATTWKENAKNVMSELNCMKYDGFFVVVPSQPPASLSLYTPNVNDQSFISLSSAMPLRLYKITHSGVFFVLCRRFAKFVKC